VARKVSLAPGSIIVDRGYTDYKLFADWSDNDIYFVTRLKENAGYRVLERRPVPTNRNLLSDELVVFTGYYPECNCPYVLRRIEVEDRNTGSRIVFLTNHLEFGATSVAAVYKDRWQIELFFKALKQNLKIKTFVGTTENALYIQIWAALIAMLLIKLLQFKSKFQGSLSNLVAFLRCNLFTYRDLWDWIDSPFETVPIAPKSVQKPLPFRGVGQHVLKRGSSPKKLVVSAGK
jgi:IS4 transposase